MEHERLCTSWVEKSFPFGRTSIDSPQETTRIDLLCESKREKRKVPPVLMLIKIEKDEKSQGQTKKSIPTTRSWKKMKKPHGKGKISYLYLYCCTIARVTFY